MSAEGEYLHEGADRYHKSIEYELLRSVLGLNLFTDGLARVLGRTATRGT